MPFLSCEVFILKWKTKMGVRFLALSSPSLLPPPPFSLHWPCLGPPPPLLLLRGLWVQVHQALFLALQSQLSSHLNDVDKLPSMGLSFSSTLSPLSHLVWFPFYCCDRISWRNNSRERASSSSQFQVPAHPDRGVNVWGGWVGVGQDPEAAGCITSTTGEQKVLNAGAQNPFSIYTQPSQERCQACGLVFLYPFL